MNKEIDTKTLGAIGGVFMLAVSAVLFFMVWNTTKPVDSTESNFDNQPQIISIETEKKQAEDLVAGKNNFSGMPITEPKSEVVGKDNPFGN